MEAKSRRSDPRMWRVLVPYALLGIAAGGFASRYITGGLLHWPAALVVVAFVSGALLEMRRRGSTS